jgi:hypothetical protein
VDLTKPGGRLPVFPERPRRLPVVDKLPTLAELDVETMALLTI